MWENYGETIMQEVKEYKTLVDKQRKELREKEMIVDSLEYTLTQKIRAIIMPYNSKMLDAAFGNKDVEMRKFINKDLQERLFSNEKAKLIGIHSQGYDQCAYAYFYEYKDCKLCFTIPVIERVNAKNLEDVSYGKYKLTYEEKPGFYRFITSSYDMDEIEESIKNFLNNQKK